MKTDIVYIVGRGSKWNDNELRFSLRSIAKYGRNVGKVVIVGHCPEWVDRTKVKVVECDDETNVKHTNIALKIRKAISVCGLKKPFLISSDDHFYVKETDFSTYPHYYKKELRVEQGGTEYTRSLFETRLWLERRGLPTLMSNPHCNTWIDPKVFVGMIDEVLEGEDAPDGLEINCVMGNLWKAMGGEMALYKDGKLHRRIHYRMWKVWAMDKDCISIGDQSIDENWCKYIWETFPEQCKYEKTGVKESELYGPDVRHRLRAAMLGITP